MIVTKGYFRTVELKKCNSLVVLINVKFSEYSASYIAHKKFFICLYIYIYIYDYIYYNIINTSIQYKVSTYE